MQLLNKCFNEAQWNEMKLHPIGTNASLCSELLLQGYNVIAPLALIQQPLFALFLHFLAHCASTYVYICNTYLLLLLQKKIENEYIFYKCLLPRLKKKQEKISVFWQKGAWGESNFKKIVYWSYWMAHTASDWVVIFTLKSFYSINQLL